MINGMPIRKESGRLAALDGLRGWGALSVVLFHTYVSSFPLSETSAEILRRIVLFNGEFAVWVFFVVSGFSLSIGFFETGDRRGILKIGAGRYVRLAIPILAASMIVWLLGPLLVPVADRPAKFQEAITHAPSIVETLYFALFGTFFRYNVHTALIPPLWTMPYELYGSMIVFAALLLIGRWRWRIAILAGMAGAFYLHYPAYSAFCCGVILAAIHVRVPRVGAWALVLLLVALISCALLPPTDHGKWSIFIAVPIVFCAVSNAQVNAFFDRPFSRWLGTISFPLYLNHSVIFYTFAMAMPHGLVTNIATDVIALVLATLFVPMDRLGTAVSRWFGRFIVAKAASLRPAWAAKWRRPHPDLQSIPETRKTPAPQPEG